MSVKFEIEEVIDKLKKNRKIFTSEADLQLEMALAIKDIYKDKAIVRVEYCPINNPTMHIDILVIMNGKWIPIELKYKTKEFKYTDLDGCVYNLKEQSANDSGCYDYIRDINRVEIIRKNYSTEFSKGYAIILTNDKYYLKERELINETSPKHQKFFIFENKTIGPNQDLEWVGSIDSIAKERKNAIHIESEYKFVWNEYSNLEVEDNNNANIFYLMINEISN